MSQPPAEDRKQNSEGSSMPNNSGAAEHRREAWPLEDAVSSNAATLVGDAIGQSSGQDDGSSREAHSSALSGVPSAAPQSPRTSSRRSNSTTAAPLFSITASTQQHSTANSCSAQMGSDGAAGNTNANTNSPLFSIRPFAQQKGASDASSSAPLFNIIASGHNSPAQQQPRRPLSSSADSNAPLFDINMYSSGQQQNNAQQQQGQGSAAPLFNIAAASGQQNSSPQQSSALASRSPLFNISGPSGQQNSSQQQQHQHAATEARSPLFHISGSGQQSSAQQHSSAPAAPLFNMSAPSSARGQQTATQMPNQGSSAPPLFNMSQQNATNGASSAGTSHISSNSGRGNSEHQPFATAALPLFNIGQRLNRGEEPQRARLQRHASSQMPADSAPLFSSPIMPHENGASGTHPLEDDRDTSDSDHDSGTGWLVASCDVGTTEPQSLSQELERLQVLKSYHILDPDRDESFDRMASMASRCFGTPFSFLSLVDMGRIWFRCNPEAEGEVQFTRDTLSCCSRVILKQSDVFVIPDTSKDELFRQGNINSGPVQFRFFAGAPLLSPEGYRLGAICVLGIEPRPDGISEDEKTILKDFADLAVKTMVDRRKLTTQGSPSHLVAATAHDLITPLTGIQLSLSLLQQDTDFLEKLGDKRTEYISAAVRSSNMMLRICQSTIETLRGNRKLPNSTDWSLPRNLMQIAESSPFIDMLEFVNNLEVISSSIPKRVPLKITLHPDAPTNIISDGLKIFRSALNILSNACSRTETGCITFTIYDDQEGSLVFECEDTGEDIQVQDCQSLFSQENDAAHFGLYSVAYQINWLGGKYGYRIRGETPDEPMTMEDAKPPAKQSSTPAEGNKNGGSHRGSIFWFSIPLVLPQDVSELMGLARTLTEQNNEPVATSNLPTTPPASPQIEEYQYQNQHENQHEQQSPASDQEDNNEGEGERKRKLKALIIEDSNVVRKILARALTKLEYQVYEAVDGMEGLRELKNTMFDIVLCDFLMPVMDGLDCVQQYREWERSHRQYFKQYIVGISAHASRNDIERGLKLGMDDFKPKPIVLKTLTELHESSALKGVRTKLDDLLNFPSFESTNVIEEDRQRELEMKLSEVAKKNSSDDDDSQEPAFKKAKVASENGKLK